MEYILTFPETMTFKECNDVMNTVYFKREVTSKTVLSSKAGFAIRVKLKDKMSMGLVNELITSGIKITEVN